MAVNTRAIRRRLKSVKSTKKITKAMEMVAASKMRKAVASALSTRPYAKTAWATVRAVSASSNEITHPLLETPKETKKVLLVLMTSDRGLAGGFNVNVVKSAIATVKEVGVPVDAVCVGKKGADAMRRLKQNIVASFVGLTNKPTYVETLPISRFVLDEFMKGTYQRVYVAYTDYRSAISQRPVVLELLPLRAPDEANGLGESKGAEPVTVNLKGEYLFEPNPASVLDRLLPQLVRTMVWQALLESAASEHSSRMLAMRNASDSASDMIDALTFTYNQARQAGITREIAEISGGKAALENV
jgi:F-type H+-transporting ATPase subunit gamma